MRLAFDHGTLILQSASPELAAELPSLRWDARTQVYRAPAYRYRQLCAELKRRRAAFQDDVRRPIGVPNAWRDIELRPYQQAALCAWQRRQSGMVVLPTGSGKTRVACAVMAVCGAPALCLVSRVWC